MPLLTELETFAGWCLYKYAAPTALSIPAPRLCVFALTSFPSQLFIAQTAVAGVGHPAGADSRPHFRFRGARPSRSLRLASRQMECPEMRPARRRTLRARRPRSPETFGPSAHRIPGFGPRPSNFTVFGGSARKTAFFLAFLALFGFQKSFPVNRKSFPAYRWSLPVNRWSLPVNRGSLAACRFPLPACRW